MSWRPPTTIREEPVELDADMRADDIVTELQRLKFNGDELQVIRVDQHVRDYLVGALNARHKARRA